MSSTSPGFLGCRWRTGSNAQIHCSSGTTPWDETKIQSRQRQDLVLPDQPVNRDPVAAIPYQEAGTLHAAQDSLLQAIKDYDEAIRLDPRYVKAYYSRGFVFNRLERPYGP